VKTEEMLKINEKNLKLMSDNSTLMEFVEEATKEKERMKMENDGLRSDCSTLDSLIRTDVWVDQ
jgi:hypothetical protein